MAETYIPRLRTHYDDVVRAGLTETFNYVNPMQVPKLEKVVLTWVSAKRLPIPRR